jgi:hypothetical protein
MKSPKNRVYKLIRPGLEYVIFHSPEDIRQFDDMIIECLKDAEIGEKVSLQVIEMTTKQLNELPEITE